MIPQTSSSHPSMDLEEKQAEPSHVEDVVKDGTAATDLYGNALVEVDHVKEAALRRKIDMYLLPAIIATYLFCFIDRANIGNARVAGMEAGLGMKPTDYGGYGYNLLLTAFYVPYVVFEIPGNFLCKIIGPGKFLPAMALGFGLFSMLMAFAHSFGAAFAFRFMLGVTESVFFPGVGLALSRWYLKAELGFRFACFLVAVPLAGSFGGLLASGFLSTPGFGSVTSWRIIFFAEGLITMGLAAVLYVMLPDSPATAWFLTPEERALCILRIKRENVGARVQLDKITKKVAIQSMTNATTLANAAVFFLGNLPVQGLGFFLPSILRAIFPDLTTVQLQLRTVPPYIVGAFVMICTSYAGWKLNRRAIFVCAISPFIALGYAIFLGTANPQARYFACFCIALASATGPLTTSWATINTTSDTQRAATIATVILAGNCGGLTATWTYISKLNNPEPTRSQLPGNSVNLAGGLLMCFISGALVLWQRRENKQKAAGRDDHRLEGLSQDAVEELAQRHPGYRYLY